MIPPLLDSSCPSRPPAWRWELATDGLDRPFRPCKDPLVRAAKRFYHCWVQCRGEADRRLLAARMPVLSEAFEIYRDPTRPTHHALEARVLAGEPRRDIARKCAVSEKVVQVYEHLYFDVRARLMHADFIGNEVLGARLRSGAVWTYDLVWKFFGFVGGSRVLDLVMDVYNGSTRPTSYEAAAGFLSEGSRTILSRQLAVAVRTLQAGNGLAALELLKAAGTLILKDSEDGAGSLNVFEQHVKAMLSEIPWAAGDAGAKTMAPEVAPFDESSVELNDEELLRLSAGEKMPKLDSIKDLKMPKPRQPKSPPKL